jgi:hypothetical protein
MNENSWSDDGADGLAEDDLFEILRQEVGRPPTAAVLRAIATVKENLERAQGTHTDAEH